MFRTLMITATAVLFSTAAFADPMATRYDNTTVITNAKGEVTKIHYNKDNTFEAMGPQGTMKGTWAITDGTLCLTQTEPAPAADAKPICNPVAEHAVGDKWEMGEGDAKVMIELVAGR
ncbi:MAG: hypothetical protein HXY22_07035 [Alphaproteobacteria bacterium]|nr:hypothetical protein [Alphaproteobacteria bacterium]